MAVLDPENAQDARRDIGDPPPVIARRDEAGRGGRRGEEVGGEGVVVGHWALLLPGTAPPTPQFWGERRLWLGEVGGSCAGLFAAPAGALRRGKIAGRLDD